MASSTARAAGAGGEISDDVLREVLARLIPSGGIQGLLRCAATCRRWRRVATDRAFLRRIGLWPDNARRPSLLLGAFFQNYYSFVSKLPPNHHPPQFRSLQPGGADLAFDSFVPNDDGLFDLARPLASRGGLLLVRVLLPGDEYECGSDGHGQRLHLAVCDPLAVAGKQQQGARRLLLPRPPFDLVGPLDRGLAGCALLTDADYGADDDDDLDLRTVKVLLLYTDKDGLVRACGYSSATGTWSAPVSCCRATEFVRCGPRAGVVAAGGTVHWVCRAETSFYTLDVDTSAATTRVSLTETPVKVHATQQQPPLPCVVKQGRLSMVNMRDRGVLELWTERELQDDACSGGHDREREWGWVRSELIDLGRDRIDAVFFAESRGALLVEQGGAFFSAVDLESKEKLLLGIEDEGMMGHAKGECLFPASSCTSTCCKGFSCGWNCDYNPPVLYEADWVFSFTPADDDLTILAATPLHGVSAARARSQRKKLLADTQGWRELWTEREQAKRAETNKDALLVEQGGASSGVDPESNEKRLPDIKDEETTGHVEDAPWFPEPEECCGSSGYCGWTCDDYAGPVLYEGGWVSASFPGDDEPATVAATPLRNVYVSAARARSQRERPFANTTCCRGNNQSEDGACTILIGEIPVKLVTPADLPPKFRTPSWVLVGSIRVPI